MATSDDRRRYLRYAIVLSVELRRPGLLQRMGRPAMLDVIDFSRHGIGGDTDEVFASGDEVRVWIKQEKFALKGVPALVRSQRIVEGRHRLGIEFVVADDNETLLTSLHHAERVVKRL